jgi:pyruvate dehydrogenase E2 component (dihydrolipoamide acetyltransferase)
MSINKKIFATPKTRKFARELGANISEIAGTQRAGRITNDDVKNYINNKLNNPKLDSKNSKEKTNLKVEFDHSDFGEVEVIDMPRIKRIAAPNLSNSWKLIPHVTHHDEADISELEEFRLSLKDRITGEIRKITLKKYFHIGIAVDTKHGLMVPKIREADKKNFNQLSENLKEISDKCRKLKIDKKEFFGGSITVTSLGSIGGSFFTPIINYPEVAILGIGKKYYKQVYIDNEFKKRIMLPLSLSYDHRIIDGAEAARFCNDLKENLGKNFAYKLAI